MKQRLKKLKAKIVKKEKQQAIEAAANFLEKPRPKPPRP